MNSNQEGLFIVQPRISQGDAQQPLGYLIKELKAKNISIPPFQRDYVWDNKKGRSWIATIEKQSSIGVFVLYQLADGGPLWLADGYQRIKTTSLYLENPEKFGRPYGPEQAEQFVWEFTVTVQKRIYKDHSEALWAFQSLNSGTSLTPFEYFQGILSIHEVGRVVYERCISSVESQQDILCRRKMERQRAHTFSRDCLALFFQYTSGYTGLNYWDVGTKNIDLARENNLETLVINHIRQWTLEEANKELDNFAEYIANLRAIIHRVVLDNGGKDMHPIIFRYLLHLGIWRKNTNRPVDKYIEFTNKILGLFSNKPAYSGVVIILREDKDPWQFNTRLNDIHDLGKICDYLGSDFYTSNKRTKNISAMPAHHESHVLPFSKYGNGNTFSEPALMNISRGVKEINA